MASPPSNDSQRTPALGPLSVPTDVDKKTTAAVPEKAEFIDEQAGDIKVKLANDKLPSPEEIIERLGIPKWRQLERKIVRCLAMTLLPTLWVVYVFNYLDRASIGHARISTPDKGLGLEGYQFGAAVFRLHSIRLKHQRGPWQPGYWPGLNPRTNNNYHTTKNIAIVEQVLETVLHRPLFDNLRPQHVTMPLKPRYMRMRQDDLAWEKGDKEAQTWEKSLLKAQVYRDIGKFINQHRYGDPVELHSPIRGGYNIFFRLEYKDGSSAALRIPCKGIVRCPDEKICYKVATMRYIAEKNTIPVAKVYHHGTAAENPTGLGPFIIMDYTEHDRTMSEALNDPAINSSESHVLNPNVSTEKLEVLYRQMANIVFQLSTLTFDRIGSLVQREDGGFHVSGRPLTMNMNSILEFTEAPPSLLPNRQYSTATEWYSALADMHLTQLVFQHNDAVEDEDDARDKYVARQLFRRLAVEGRLVSELDTKEGRQSGNEAAFRMFSEDLRPSNVLIDKDLRVVGVIDWEFAYIAPSQFSYDPPWWLLLKAPDEWSEGGYMSWMETYRPRLGTFLRLLEEEEEKEVQAGPGSTSRNQGGMRLSQQMRKRWESRAWMINYAARNSWAFDFIYWKFLDMEFFGDNKNGDHHERLGMLTKAEAETMEEFVRMKMQERSERALVEWNDESAATRLAKFIV